MTTEYELALKASREATAAFRKVQQDYRALRIGDAEFLAEKARYEKASATFDAAFRKAQDGAR